eukprot:259122_1
MGNKSSKVIHTFKIDNEPTNAKRIKCLLSGSGSVGKTTIFQHIRLIYMENKSAELLSDGTTARIQSDCVQAVLQLIQMAQNSDDKCLINDDIKKCIDVFERFKHFDFRNDNGNLHVLGEAIDTIWKLDAIKQIFEHKIKHKYDYCDNIELFLNKIKLIMNARYVPNIEDCLKCRRTTSGITNIRYQTKSNQHFEFQMFDVGGMRNQRKKWIHIFDELECVIFVVALNQFCIPIIEDETVFGLHENMEVWKQIANSRWLNKCKMCLLFNKTDLFRQSLIYNSLTICFGNEYKGR